MKTFTISLVVLMLTLIIAGGCLTEQEKTSAETKSIAGIPVDNAEMEQALDDLTTLEALELENVKDW